MHEEKKSLVIINPISGTRKKGGLEDITAEILTPAGYQLDFAYTEGPADASRMAAKAAASGYHSVITAGGDGTVNEAARALTGTRTALGIIPCGSGNGLARSLGIPSDFKVALKTIADGNIILADHGVVNSIPFFCTFGVGFDAAVSEKFANAKRRGKISYIQSVLREFLEYTPQSYGLSINGEVLTDKAFLIAVANAPQYGNNAYIAPKASITDGFLDITVIHSGSPLSTALMGVDLMTGYLDRNTLIDTFRVSEATIIRLDKGPAHVDGEPIELGKVLNVQCRPASLRLYAPDADMRVKPIISPLKAFFSDLHYDLLDKLRSL